MSIPLLPEFDADGYQVEPTTADINDLIAATNTATGAEIATLPTFTANGQQTEPSIAKLNEIITALNDGGAELDLLPTFAVDGYETKPTTITFNAVTTFVNEYEPPGIAIESSTTSTTASINKPAGVEAGDVLVAVVRGANSTGPMTMDGFSHQVTASNGSDRLSILTRVSTGAEGSNFTAVGDSGIFGQVMYRVSGVNGSAPVEGTPTAANASSDSVVVASITSTSENAVLLVAGAGYRIAGTATGLTWSDDLEELHDISGSLASIRIGAASQTIAAPGATGTRTVTFTSTGGAANAALGAMIVLSPA